MKYCSDCGSPLALENAKSCPSCGNDLLRKNRLNNKNDNNNIKSINIENWKDNVIGVATSPKARLVV